MGIKATSIGCYSPPKKGKRTAKISHPKIGKFEKVHPKSDTKRKSDLPHPPAPQGAVPRTHQAHQDQLGISFAEPALEAVHWNPRPAASWSLGLVRFFLSPVRARHRHMSISATYHAPRSRSGGLGPQGQFREGPAPPPGPGWGVRTRVGLRDHDFPLVIRY